eukprot:1158700-Pelagomonas_calceolata.AAC.11
MLKPFFATGLVLQPLPTQKSKSHHPLPGHVRDCACLARQESLICLIHRRQTAAAGGHRGVQGQPRDQAQPMHKGAEDGLHSSRVDSMQAHDSCKCSHCCLCACNWPTGGGREVKFEQRLTHPLFSNGRTDAYAPKTQ